MTPTEAITVVIPTSPLVLHPSTEIIDEIYAQTRKHLPEAPIVILVDGIHPEEEYLRERYEEYKKNLELRLTEWTNVTLQIFYEWFHQSGMLKRTLLVWDLIKTPLVFWSEHDIPLRDEYIDWQGIVDALLAKDLCGIRFELTGDPPKRDETLERIITHGIPVVLSTQFVNWPQVFRLDYLKDIITSFGDAKTYLECTERDGLVRERFHYCRYGIYSPEGEIRRCYHTDGRERQTTHRMGKPFIEIDGRRRYIYDFPYRPEGQ